MGRGSRVRRPRVGCRRRAVSAWLARRRAWRRGRPLLRPRSRPRRRSREGTGPFVLYARPAARGFVFPSDLCDFDPGPRTLFWSTGGAGGAAATKRQRQEKFILEGLRSFLLGSTAWGETAPAPVPDVGVAPLLAARGERAASPARPRSSSPGWQTVGRKGKGKGIEKGPAKGKVAEPREPSPRKVVFADSEPGHKTLLAQLKALVLEAETQGSANLVTSLQKLVGQYGPPAGAPSPARTPAAKVSQGARSAPVVASATDLRLNTKWWKGTVMSSAKLAEALDAADIPANHATVTTLESAATKGSR